MGFIFYGLGIPRRIAGWLSTCCVISEPLFVKSHTACFSDLPGWFLASETDLKWLKFAI